MSANVDIERALTVWMSEGVTVMPDGVTDVVAGRIAATRQRTLRWPWLAWPSYQSGRLQRAASVAAILVVAAAIGFGLFNGGIFNPARPSQTPATNGTPRPSSAPSSAPTSPPPTSGPSAGPENLGPGTHHSTVWQPTVSFTVPDGWAVTSDSAQIFAIAPLADDGSHIQLAANVYVPASQVADCSAVPTWTEPHSSLDLLAYLESNPALSTTSTGVNVGGYIGWLVEIDVLSALESACDPASVGLYTVRYSEGEAPLTIGSGPGLHRSLYVLDDRASGAIVLESRAQTDSGSQEISQIIESLEFAPPPPPTDGTPTGLLAAGTHRSGTFAPALTYTVPDGFSNGADERSIFTLDKVDDSGYIEIAWDVAAYSNCRLGWNQPSQSAAEFIEQFEAAGNFDATATPITLGNISGFDVSFAQTSTDGPCGDGFRFTIKNYINTGLGGASRFVVLDDGAGHAVLIEVYADDGLIERELWDLARSFSFDSECGIPATCPLEPSPSAGPTATHSAPPIPLGDLAAGIYSSQLFVPQLTFAVPEGWSNSVDSDKEFVISGDEASKITVLWDVHPPLSDRLQCPVLPDFSVSTPHAASDLVDYLTNHPNFDTQARATSVGGLSGWSVQGTVLDSACGQVWLYRKHDFTNPLDLETGTRGQRFNFVVLDDRLGNAILIKLETAAALRDAADSIVGSFSFAKPVVPAVEATSGDGFVTFTVAAGALNHPEAISVGTINPLMRPTALDALDYSLNSYLLQPAFTSFMFPSTVTWRLTFEDFGFASPGSDMEVRPIVALAMRDADGMWSWLGSETTLGNGTIETTGYLYTAGEIYAFVVGTFDGSTWDAPPGGTATEPFVTACDDESLDLAFESVHSLFAELGLTGGYVTLSRADLGAYECPEIPL